MEKQLKELTKLVQQFKTEYKTLDKKSQQAYQNEYSFCQDFITFYRTQIPPSSLESATKKLDLVIAKILEAHQQIA